MTLIQTAKLNGVDPMAWLTDALERVVSGRTKSHEPPHSAAVQLRANQRQRDQQTRRVAETSVNRTSQPGRRHDAYPERQSPA